MRKRAVWALLLLFFAAPRAEAAWPIGEKSRVRPASVEEAREVLSARDGYIRRMSPFDRAVRMKSREPVSQEAFLEHAAGQALAWEAAEEEKLGRIMAAVNERLAKWDLPWPETILVIKTTGEEEGGAAYCRGAAIALPKEVLRRSPERLEPLVLHELFHVLSNQNPELRRKLYAVVGFEPCQEIELPESLRNRKLTNPDAPANDYVTRLTVDGEEQLVVPVLFSSHEKYDPNTGRGLFDYLNFRLMAVEPKGDDETFVPVLNKGEPVLLEVASVPAYYDRIGRNTDYIIHPEEVLADNFVLLVQEKKDVKTPALLDKLRAALRASFP